MDLPDVQYPFVKVGIIAVLLIISAVLIYSVLNSGEPEDKIFEYENVSQRECSEYYHGMWNQNLNSCLSKFPTGLIPCIDNSLSKDSNDGVFYCDPKDVDVKPDQVQCDFDVYNTRYCVLKEN